jgi:hypothetical protein
MRTTMKGASGEDRANGAWIEEQNAARRKEVILHFLFSLIIT